MVASYGAAAGPAILQGPRRSWTLKADGSGLYLTSRNAERSRECGQHFQVFAQKITTRTGKPIGFDVDRAPHANKLELPDGKDGSRVRSQGLLQ